CLLPKFKVNEVFSFMSHIASKISSHDAMPCGVIFFVKFLKERIQICCNIFLNVVFLQCLGGALYSILLHGLLLELRVY
uniref:Uncharacterized protein n=1 Tax=Erpetoichthys calabaricus TaxID=27687 RepID=A0A8C4TG28_ERPCA